MTDEDVERVRVPKFEWEKLMLVSELAWATRAVLLALAVYMSEDGGNARPGLRNMATVTGLTERSLGGHLRKAVDTGYLGQLSRGGYRGGKAGDVRQVRASMYVATVPKYIFDIAVEILQSPPWRKSEPEAGFRFTLGRTPAPGAPPQDLHPAPGAPPDVSEPEIQRSEPEVQRSEPEAGFRLSSSYINQESSSSSASASRGAAPPFGRRSATARSDQAIGEATARRTTAIAAKIIIEDTGVDREDADRFIRWLLVNRSPVKDLIGYVRYLADSLALGPLMEQMETDAELGAFG